MAISLYETYNGQFSSKKSDRRPLLKRATSTDSLITNFLLCS